MFNLLFKKIRNFFTGARVRRKYQDINPEDIFMDSTNLPGFEEHALEGRIEKPIGNITFSGLKVVLAVLLIILIGKLWFLSILDGKAYAEISENNRLEQTTLFANRGAILDRNGVELATNDIKNSTSTFAGRSYAAIPGLSHVVGYIKYPAIDKNGNYIDKDYKAKDGAELTFDSILKGTNGEKLVETDVTGKVTSESVVNLPQDGGTVKLSVDAKVTEVLYNAIKNLAQSSRFTGGAGVIMNVKTGEILALTSYPEYDQNQMTKGIDAKTFTEMLNGSGKPFLDRVAGGLYTPGSVIKPIVALGALNEKIISPDKAILSTGSISVPNPYDPSKPSIFKDWRVNGWTNMSQALSVSSDVYFYTVGGGYGDQKGLGITLLDKYFSQFGLEEKTGINLPGEIGGLIATPQWKAQHFNGDIWRLGDTYITSIGQFGTQVTPINIVRYISAIANEGTFLKPSILLGGDPHPVEKTLSFPQSDWDVIHSGMRGSVTFGTSAVLNVPYVQAAGKTGTAEVGNGKSYVHSWSVGFFPYNNPQYAWAVVMEKGPSTNTVGAATVMRQVFDWMENNEPQYLQ